MVSLRIDERRTLNRAEPLLFGQFIEHFGRLIYGGLFDPGHPLSDSDGFRADVIEALQKLRIPIIRWPGGCFVSAYHWINGVDPNREAVYDKAWCVEESNAFGTDEFMLLCQKLGAEPYICTNAGTGTPEEMADWVEYVNEPKLGRWAKLRARNGHPQPYGVKYWSIGNENYTGGEIGAKRPGEWGAFVRESAKMMRRVDPSIKLLAAGVPDLDWNLNLLRSAGDLIDYVSIHGYFDPAWENNALSGYVKSLQAVSCFERDIRVTKGLLTALGLEKRVHIAYDEWNLRGWYHPGVADFSKLAPDHAWAAAQREKNEDNTQYTMADAVFAAGFLNTCMRHGDAVTLANFSPTVCGRGLIGVNDQGIVLRPTYHVFDLLRNHMGDRVVDSYAVDVPEFDAQGVAVPTLDAVAALDEQNRLTLSLINRHPAEALEIELSPARAYSAGTLYTVNGPHADSSNDYGRPNAVRLTSERLACAGRLRLKPHSVNLLVYDAV